MPANPETVVPNQQVQFLTISADGAGQRIDNFLLGRLKGVPRSRIYRIIRKGEVRVNKKRVRPDYKLLAGDEVRLPPVRTASREADPVISDSLRQCLLDAVLFEDDQVMVFNKPPGLAVHTGTGVHIGMIEALRQLYENSQLALAHRIDKGTSGCLLVAKNLQSLNAMTAAFKARKVAKTYHALVEGDWPEEVVQVDTPLTREAERNGERRVSADPAGGKPALTEFRVLERLGGYTLLEARPATGRTHQIRVHCQLVGHPICGDDKYQSDAGRARDRARGIRRLCLHAASLSLTLPGGKPLQVEAPYDDAFTALLQALGTAGPHPPA